MSLQLVNLDAVTRPFMVDEIELDVANNRIYPSPRLSEVGTRDFPILLIEAARNFDDAWLANELRKNGRMNDTEQRRKPKGGFTVARVPVTAPDTLAEGELNRFYARGLSVRAINEGITALEIYRAKAVSQPRYESEAKIGARIDPKALLNDLRTHVGVDTALGLPPGPNSGLSVKLPWIK